MIVSTMQCELKPCCSILKVMLMLRYMYCRYKLGVLVHCVELIIRSTSFFQINRSCSTIEATMVTVFETCPLYI